MCYNLYYFIKFHVQRCDVIVITCQSQVMGGVVLAPTQVHAKRYVRDKIDLSL